MPGSLILSSRRNGARYCSSTKLRDISRLCQDLHLTPAKTYTFIPIACETLGPINIKALFFLADLGRHIALVIGDPREGSFLFQHLAMALLPLHLIRRASATSTKFLYQLLQVPWEHSIFSLPTPLHHCPTF